MKPFLCLIHGLLFLLLAACGPEPEPEVDVATLTWPQILERARGREVNLMMWQGDPLINRFMREYVQPTLADSFGITLTLSSGQGSQIVNLLMAEREAGRSDSQIDMGWINGETFYQLRQLEALYGPFTDRLPNGRYIDWDDPFIAYDFQKPVNGMECPWGNVQLAFIYDSLRVPAPPRRFADLPAFIRAHPGTFTIPNEFTGMTLLKSWMMALSGEPERFYGPFDEALYEDHSQRLWDTLRSLKPYLWQEGSSFPESLAGLHQMFANGEVDFTFSNNDSEVDNKIRQGLFPESARAYAPAPGTIRNSHYMGIFRRSPRQAASLVVANFLISPEAQWRKMDPTVWGDGTVLDLERLPLEWQEKFRRFPGRTFAPSRETLDSLALMEPAPEYMIRLYEDFRSEVMASQ